MIVTPLKEKDDPGNTADAKYETVVLKYEDQEEGKPYITAEFPKGLVTTAQFPVGDGKYYSQSGVTDSKRKRRSTCKLALNLGVTLLFGVEGYVTPTKQSMVFVLKGSLRNDDDDDDNVKKTIEIMSKTTALHVHHAF